MNLNSRFLKVAFVTLVLLSLVALEDAKRTKKGRKRGRGRPSKSPRASRHHHHYRDVDDINPRHPRDLQVDPGTDPDPVGWSGEAPPDGGIGGVVAATTSDHHGPQHMPGSKQVALRDGNYISHGSHGHSGTHDGHKGQGNDSGSHTHMHKHTHKHSPKHGSHHHNHYRSHKHGVAHSRKHGHSPSHHRGRHYSRKPGHVRSHSGSPSYSHSKSNSHVGRYCPRFRGHSFSHYNGGKDVQVVINVRVGGEKEPEKERKRSKEYVYARCDVVNNHGNHSLAGYIAFRQRPGEDVHLRVNISGFFQNASGDATGPPDGYDGSSHGMHVHEYGDLSNGCSSFGGHFNPEGVEHGGPGAGHQHKHVGDFGNIWSESDGTAQGYYRIDDAVLKGEKSIVGRGIVIHAEEDNLGHGHTESSKVSGDAGSRIGCCVISYVAAITEW